MKINTLSVCFEFILILRVKSFLLLHCILPLWRFSLWRRHPAHLQIVDDILDFLDVVLNNYLNLKKNIYKYKPLTSQTACAVDHSSGSTGHSPRQYRTGTCGFGRVDLLFFNLFKYYLN